MSKPSFLSFIPTDILKVISAFIMMIPLGWIFKQIKNTKYRKFTSIVWGNMLLILLYSSASLHIYSCILINILILKFCDRKEVGKYAFIYNMAHNSYINLYNQIYYYNEPRMDSVGIPFMMLILKHIAFAYSYQDSAYIEKTETNSGAESAKSQMTFKDGYFIYPENRVYVIENFSIYEYVNYILFYPTIVGGPFIEFNDYKRFIGLKGEYEKIPASTLLAVKRFFFGFACLVAFFAVNPYNKVENLIDYENKFSALQKILFYILGFFYVVRYFGGFSLLEIGCLSCGFAYGKETYEMRKAQEESGKSSQIAKNPSFVSSSAESNLDSSCGEAFKESASDSNNCTKENLFFNKNENNNNNNKNEIIETTMQETIMEFQKAKVIDWINLLMIYDPDEFFRYWNIHVHHFLKRNVYLRNISTPEEQKANPHLAKVSKNRASSMTFFLSAFWHGFYPPYFIVFFHFYLLTFISAQVKALNAKINLVHFFPFYKNLIRFIVVVILIPYHCLFFVSLDYKTLYDWIVTSKSFATVIALGLLLVVAVLNVLFKGKKVHHEEKKNH